MAERLYRTLMQRILADIEGQAFAGALPNEVGVASRYGVSRGAAREAIRGLEERGVVAVTHGRGQVIRAEDRWDVADAAVLLALARGGANPSLIAEAVAARVLVEAPAARRAAASSAAAEVLREALGALQAHKGFRARPRGPHDAPVEAEVAFHRALMAWSGNRVAAAMVDSLHEPLAVLRHELLPGRDAAALRHAERLVAAAEAGDADAAEAAVRNQGKQQTSWFRALAATG